VTSDEPNSPKSFSVKPLSDSQIVDTNGAGDAFAGGFLAGLVAGKNLDESILAGHALASACVQEVSSRTVDK
jgi:adenosine kinase